VKRHPVYPWITESSDTLIRHCERCGKSIVYTSAQRLTQWSAMLKSFVEKHRECEEKPDGHQHKD
jgi:hypothetical protein